MSQNQKKKQDWRTASSRWRRWSKPCDLAIGFCTSRISVDVVDKQAQWMPENSSAPPTMDSHVLAMDLLPVLFIHASPTDLGLSHGRAPHGERSKSTSGRHWQDQHVSPPHEHEERGAYPPHRSFCSGPWGPGLSRKCRMGCVPTAVVAWWRHAWWTALGGYLYLDTSVTKLLLVLMRRIINFYGSSK